MTEIRLLHDEKRCPVEFMFPRQIGTWQAEVDEALENRYTDTVTVIVDACDRTDDDGDLEWTLFNYDFKVYIHDCPLNNLYVNIYEPLALSGSNPGTKLVSNLFLEMYCWSFEPHFTPERTDIIGVFCRPATWNPVEDHPDIHQRVRYYGRNKFSLDGVGTVCDGYSGFGAHFRRLEIFRLHRPFDGQMVGGITHVARMYSETAGDEQADYEVAFGMPTDIMYFVRLCDLHVDSAPRRP